MTEDVAHLDVRPGDRIRYHGTYGVVEADVIEVKNDQLLMVRRHAPTLGIHGIRPIRRDRLVEIVDYRL